MNILLAGQNGIIGSFLYEELKSQNKIIGIGKGEFNSPNYTDLDLLNRVRVHKFVIENKQFDVLIFLGLISKSG
jgi:dTDP-4-dehydrorhamnose reductase